MILTYYENLKQNKNVKDKVTKYVIYLETVNTFAINYVYSTKGNAGH